MATGSWLGMGPVASYFIVIVVTLKKSTVWHIWSSFIRHLIDSSFSCLVTVGEEYEEYEENEKEKILKLISLRVELVALL